MPTSAAQVEALQAPPGLEAIHNPAAAGRPPSTPPPLDPSTLMAPPSTGNIKQASQDELVRQVSQAIAQQVEEKTMAAVEALWEKGQKAMHYLHQQQQQETAKLQGQLTSCAESYQQLKHDNYILRQGLEAMMQRVQVLYHTTPQLTSPFLPPQDAAASAQLAAAMALVQAQSAASAQQAAMAAQQAAASQQQQQQEQRQQLQQQAPVEAAVLAAPPSAAAPLLPPSLPTTATATTPTLTKDAEDFHTPATSPLRQAVEQLENAPAPATPQLSAQKGGALPNVPGFPLAAAALSTTAAALGAPAGATDATAADTSMPSPRLGLSTPQPAASSSSSTFKITLRRADGVPLGLDVRGDSGEPFLEVQAVKPGGAVEALNRQFAGDFREIRPGDRIIAINGAEEADAMLQQCMQKYLLKMTVSRSAATEPGTPQSAGARSMRAEADEFVPQSPWPTPTSTPIIAPGVAPAGGPAEAPVAAPPVLPTCTGVTSTMTSC